MTPWAPRATLPLRAERTKDVARAAEILRGGGLVAFPTETVYGLGANALSAEAVSGIFVAKQRPAWDPLIVHLAEAEWMGSVVELGADGVQPSSDRQQIPAGNDRKKGKNTGDFFENSRNAEEIEDRVRALARAFWPGPLTLLLPRRDCVPDAVTAGRALVGVRVPAHPVARQLLRLVGVPVAAPSANRFGHVSPTTAQHVFADLDGRIDAVLDGGAAVVGVESTVVDPAQSPMRIYRAGAVTPAMLEEVTGVAAAFFAAEPLSREAGPESLPSPGVGIRHYAPGVPVLLSGPTALELETRVQEALSIMDRRVGVLMPVDWTISVKGAAVVEPWGRWSEPETLAAGLFAGLRTLEERGVGVMICPLPEPGGLRDALRDRLRKAAMGG